MSRTLLLKAAIYLLIGGIVLVRYLQSIRFICLAMSDEYIDSHFEEIKSHCSGRVKKAIPRSDRMGHYGSRKKGSQKKKATTTVHNPYIMMSANASTI